MIYKNATPHKISIQLANGEFLDLPACANAPRLSTSRQTLGEYDGVVIKQTTLGMPEGMPEQEDGTLWIVSALVAEHPALRDRTDLAYPGEPIRDADGNIIACAGLCAGPGLARKIFGGQVECNGPSAESDVQEFMRKVWIDGHFNGEMHSDGIPEHSNAFLSLLGEVSLVMDRRSA